MAKINATGFIPTRTIAFSGSLFPSCTLHRYPSDGWHSVGVEKLCIGDINEGADLLCFLTEAAGQKGTVDYDSLLRVKVEDNMVQSVYAPGIMGGEKSLWLVSGDNKFELIVDVENSIFTVGELTGRLKEKTYKRFDESEGVSVAIAFTPNDPRNKVIYEVSLIHKRREDLARLFGSESIVISKELIEHLLKTEEEALDDKAGVQAVSNTLLQVLGASNDRKKLHTLGANTYWEVIDFEKIVQTADAKYPPNYALTLKGEDGKRLEGSYYTNKALTDQLNKLGSVLKGKRLALLIGAINPYNDSFTVKACLQLLEEPIRDPATLRSAAAPVVGLPQSKPKALAGTPESAIDVESVNAPDYDSLPF